MNGVLEGMTNPLTRRTIRLIPPIEIYTDDEFAIFVEWFQAQCLRHWRSDDWAAKDPKTMDASGWRDACADSPSGC